jgi:RNA polymerase sigma-70 factor (ECF subfamily)
VNAADDLRGLFLLHAPPASPARHEENLEQTLRACFEAGRTSWPEVPLEIHAFVRHLAERSTDGLPPLARAPDLYIACACASGSPRALEVFHRSFRDDVARAVSRTDRSPAFLDDVLQLLSVKLFVRVGDEPPGIVEYGGRASLRGWLATVAKRTALNMRRRRDEQAHDEVSSGVAALGSAVGPEVALLRARYKAEFEAAIRVALAAMPPKDRTLLLLHLVNGVTLPQLAAMQNVSRATLARWLATAREALFEGTRRSLTEKLSLSPNEYESVVAMIRSQLELSVVAAMAAPAIGR